jgi:hypothetical protein
LAQRSAGVLAEITGLGLFPPQHWKDLHCVVDVGANEGHWSTDLLELVHPARLIIIEPGPPMFAQLRKNSGQDREWNSTMLRSVTGTARRLSG